MNVAVRIIGIVIVCIAIVYLLKPNSLKRIIEFFKQGKRLYFIGLLRLVLAVVFLLAATRCDKPGVIGAFGILFLISGLLIFILGLERLKAILDWYQKQSLLFIRAIAVIALVIGAAIIYCA